MKFLIHPITTIFLFILLNSTSQATLLFSSDNIHLTQNQSHNINSAAQSIKQKTGGRILSTKSITKKGQRFYKIKVLLPSGKIRTFTVTAQ